LIRHFSREEVGCVEGRRADFSPGDSATARHELTYRDMESRIKLWESRVFSCTGATGPIYAVRRALYVPLHPAMISDLMEPILIVCRHGKRHVFEPDALSREAVLPDMGHEFRRKVRIMTRCLNSLRGAPEALSPFRAGWFSLQLFSHRVLRWLAPVVAVAAFVANVFLLPHPLYRAAFLLQISFLLVAAAGAALDRLAIGPALLRLPHYFFMSNLAALTALGNCLIGRQVIVWRPLRETETAGSARP
jgi:hypothetical protein